MVLRSCKRARLKWKGGSKEKEMKRLDQGEEERDSRVEDPVEEPGGRGAGRPLICRPN